MTFEDPEDDGRRWQIDVTFLTSHWECIFGRGCQGVLTEPAPELVQGCCSYGAHFSDTEGPRPRRAAPPRSSSDDEWQYAKAGR